MTDQLGLFADPEILADPETHPSRFLTEFLAGVATQWMYGPRPTAAQARHGREVGQHMVDSYALDLARRVP